MIGFVDDGYGGQNKIPALGELEDLKTLIGKHQVTDIVIALPYSAYHKMAEIITCLDDVPVGIWIALGTALLIYLLLWRTTRGMEMRTNADAPRLALYSGMPIHTPPLMAMVLSGALAGLAGGIEAAATFKQITPHVSTGLGFTAIIVCFVGRLHPVGIIFAGLLLSMMVIGGELGQSRLGLPNALTGVFQGLLLVLLACDTLIHYRIRVRSALAGAH